jgi:hypothetical protein
MHYIYNSYFEIKCTSLHVFHISLYYKGKSIFITCLSLVNDYLFNALRSMKFIISQLQYITSNVESNLTIQLYFYFLTTENGDRIM